MSHVNKKWSKVNLMICWYHGAKSLWHIKKYMLALNDP